MHITSKERCHNQKDDYMQIFAEDVRFMLI